MHDLLYNLGLISLTITIFYIIFWFDRRKKPSDFHLVRNHLQSITHPHLIIRGHGDFYIEYLYNDEQFFEYFNDASSYRKNLEEMNKDTAVKIINHGLIANNAWKKWGIQNISGRK